MIEALSVFEKGGVSGGNCSGPVHLADEPHQNLHTSTHLPLVRGA
jgi:hypothetical protein